MEKKYADINTLSRFLYNLKNTFSLLTHTHTKAEIGLGNVDNKSSATIRGEITTANVVNALGYTPLNENDVIDPTTATVEGFAADAKLTGDAISELNKNIQESEVVYDGNYGGMAGGNIRYNKISKILTINFFYNGNIGNNSVLTPSISALGVPIPKTNRYIAAPCNYADGSTGFFQVVIGTDDKIKVLNDSDKIMVKPIVNGSAYIG